MNEHALSGDLSKSHAPHELVLRGHTSAAASLFREAPHLAQAVDSFGTSAEALLQQALQPEPAWAHLRRGEASGGEASGGWPTAEILFPGWNRSESSEGQRCEFTEVSGAAVADDPSRFVKDFVLTSRPVIIRDLVRRDRHLTPLVEALAKAPLLAAWGSSTWEAAAIPYSKVYTAGSSSVTSLAAYVRDVIGQDHTPDAQAPPPYIFAESKPLSSTGTLVDIFPQVPEWAEVGVPNLARLRKGTAQFYLGTKGTGAPMHYHTNPAWNALVHGRKAWVLLPPNQAVFSSVPAAESVERHSRQRGALRCEQGSGDVVVVPAFWGHLTYNLRAAVGVAKEFHMDALNKKARLASA